MVYNLDLVQIQVGREGNQLRRLFFSLWGYLPAKEDSDLWPVLWRVGQWLGMPVAWNPVGQAWSEQPAWGTEVS